MAERTHIEWTDQTWNPTTGCTKVSSGCKNCYALREWGRLKSNPQTVYFGREFEQVAWHPQRLGWPASHRKPSRIFVDSMSDLFHSAIPDAFIREVFATMARAHWHTYQILTKRPDRMAQFVAMMLEEGFDFGHVQMGVSAEDQLTFEERVPPLLSCRIPVRFVSFEPLLGMIDGRGRTDPSKQISVPPVQDWLLSGLSWAIVGGESGPDARPTHPVWMRSLRDQCAAASVPFFFKQWGEWLPDGQVRIGLVVDNKPKRHQFPDGVVTWRVGKQRAGRLLDGRQHDGQATRAVA